MTRECRRPNVRVYAIALLTVIVVAGCYGGGSAASALPTEPSVEPTEQTAASGSSKPAETEPPVPESTDGCGGATVSIDYVPFDVKAAAAYGWGFVVADVVAFEPALFNTADGKRPDGFGAANEPPLGDETTIYTPVGVVVDAALSGKASAGPNEFLIEGGTVGCFTMNVYPTPLVQPGSRYVFVVSEAMKADGTEAMAPQKAMFAWPVDEKGMVTTVDGIMSIDELTKLVVDAAPAG
jgi:hypothetical protein